MTLYMVRGQGRGHIEDEDMEDIDGATEDTSTIGRGSLSHHAIRARLDDQNSLHPNHSYSPHHTTPLLLNYSYLYQDARPSPHQTSPSNLVRPYPYYTSSHYTSSLPLGHPYTHQHGASPSASHHATPSSSGHLLPPHHDTIPSSSHHHTPSPQHGTIPLSSHHTTPSPPGHVYPPEHGIGPSSSRHGTNSPRTPHSSLGHLGHSLGVGDQHAFTYRTPPARRRTPSARSSSDGVTLIYTTAIEDIPDFFRLPIAPRKAKTLLFISLLSRGLCSSLGICICHLRYTKRGVGRTRATDEAFKKKSEQISANRRSRWEGRASAALTRRVEELSTESLDTHIDVDEVYLEVVSEVKVRIYGLGSQGYHRHNNSSIEASSSRGPAYGPHELEELQRDHCNDPKI
ncbi:hypothetical protein Scep_016784 [Stephania cephalantha]|uniref:Uncharacterized protein n=1 Tax=Stephania cephalantha TaxID=152367 RepID=A0AAP0NW93_9MAGN